MDTAVFTVKWVTPRADPPFSSLLLAGRGDVPGLVRGRIHHARYPPIYHPAGVSSHWCVPARGVLYTVACSVQQWLALSPLIHPLSRVSDRRRGSCRFRSVNAFLRLCEPRKIQLPFDVLSLMYWFLRFTDPDVARSLLFPLFSVISRFVLITESHNFCL